MNEQLARHIQFLKESGIDEMGHSGQHLLDHLLGTYRLLKEWGAGEALCVAGLFHSVYGTEAYKGTTIPLSMRASVRQEIGDEGEMLAWLFGIMRRNTMRTNFERTEHFQIQNRLTEEWIPLSTEQFADLANLEVANALEQLPRLPAEYRERALSFLDFRPYIMPAAVTALEDFLGNPAQQTSSP